MRRLISSIAAVTSLALLTPTRPGAVAGAQPTHSLRSLAPGDTLKVWASVPRLRGALAALTMITIDTLTVKVVGEAHLPALATVIPLNSVGKLEVQRYYRSTGNALGMAAAGALVGLIVGSVAGTKIECRGSCNGKPEFSGMTGLLFGGGVGGLVGAVTGGLIGARPRTRWEPVSLVPR